MFQGTTLITLDDKGRLALPKRARDEAAADGVIVAARHPDGCLVLYPPSAWAPKRDALLKPVSYTHLTLPTNREV